MYRKGKGKGKGDDGGKGKGDDGGKGKGGGGGGGGGEGGGKGKGKGKDGKGKKKGKPPRPTDPEAPIGERRISDTDTAQADNTQRSHGVATRLLRDALLHRTVPSLSRALEDARSAKMSGPLVDQAE